MVGFSYHQKQQQGECLGLLWGSLSQSEACIFRTAVHTEEVKAAGQGGLQSKSRCVHVWMQLQNLSILSSRWLPAILPSLPNPYAVTLCCSPRPHGLSNMKSGLKSRKSCSKAPVLYGCILHGSEIVLLLGSHPGHWLKSRFLSSCRLDLHR